MQHLQTMEAIQLATRLTVDVDGLAEILQTSSNSIRTRLCREPHTLPPRLKLPGNTRLLWLMEDVMNWLKQCRTEPAPAPAPRKRGRPTKAEQARRRAELLAS